MRFTNAVLQMTPPGPLLLEMFQTLDDKLVGPEDWLSMWNVIQNEKGSGALH